MDFVFTFKNSFLEASCAPRYYSVRVRSGMQKPASPGTRSPTIWSVAEMVFSCQEHRGFIVYNNWVERSFSCFSCHLERLSPPDLFCEGKNALQPNWNHYKNLGGEGWGLVLCLFVCFFLSLVLISLSSFKGFTWFCLRTMARFLFF